MDTKVCKKCGVEKPVSNFSKGGKQLRANGEWNQYYKTTCKQCTNKGRTRIDNVDPKVCNKCGVSKPLAEYHYEKDRDRYRGECRQCRCNWRNAHRPNIAERLNAKSRDRWANESGYAERQRETHKKSREKHKDRRNAERRERWVNDPEYAERQRQYQRDRWANNPEYRERCKEQNRLYCEKHKEELKEKNKIYYEENKEKISEYSKQ